MLPATASARTDCGHVAADEYVVAGTPVYFQNTQDGSGATNTADIAVGACVDNVAPAEGFHGGYAEVGADTLSDPDRHGVLHEDPPPLPAPIGDISNTPATGLLGVYAVIDGDDENDDESPSDQSGGYAALSNYETGSPDPDCDGNQDSSVSSNSGGCFWLKSPVNFGLPVPLVSCGNSGGKDYSTTTRDGCYVP